MAGCGRRFAVRAGVAFVAAVIGASFTSVAPQAASPLKLNVQVGYKNLVKLGQWMPVTVDITNSGPDLQGTLEFESNPQTSGKGGPPAGVAVYQMPISLAAGATKHFRTYVMMDITAVVDVRVIQGGREVASATGASGVASGALVGVLSDQPGTLDELAAIRPGGFAPNVTHLAGSDVPDSSLVLRPFDLLAIDDFSTDTLTAAQRGALADYVINGGSLLLGTGGSWHKTLSGLPAGIVPMSVTGSTVLGSVKSLDGLSNVEVATGSLNNGTAWLSEGAQPLLVESRVGEGMVSMATFDWNQELAAGFASSATLLRQAFVRATLWSDSSTSVFPNAIPKFGFTTSLASKGGQFSQALSNLPALTLPAWWLIGALVLSYVLLVGPVNYFVLRWMNRRALAWVTIPTIALVGSAGAYGTGLLTKGTAVQANEVSIVHVEQGWSHAYQEAYNGLITPTRGDYEVGLGGGHPLVSPIYYYSGGLQDPNQSLLQVNTNNDTISLPGMSAFTLRGFATEGMTSAPHLVASSQVVGGQLVGTIQNASSIDFTDGVVISGNSFEKLGRLKPNGSISFSVLPSVSSPFTGQPVYMTIYPNMFTCCGPQATTPTDEERDAELKTAVLSTLPSGSFNGITPSTAQPTLVLWTKVPFEDITVNGNHPRSFNLGAIVVRLPITQIAAGSLTGGVVAGRMVDIEADIQQQAGPPGLLVLQSGSVTYDFAPSLARGVHLTTASILSSNQFYAKGLPGSTGPGATVKTQVWNWSQSAWTDVTYVDSGSTQIPDSAINPATGEVRFKMSSDGVFTSGYLSLVGTVN